MHISHRKRGKGAVIEKENEVMVKLNSWNLQKPVSETQLFSLKIFIRLQISQGKMSVT